MLLHLPSGASRAAASATCHSWRHVLVAAVHELRLVPIDQLAPLLSRFKHVHKASICDAATGGHVDAARVAAVLLACPRPLQQLAICASHCYGAEGLCALAVTTAKGAAWAAKLTSLELDCSFVMRLPSTMGASLQQLKHLTVTGYRNGGHGLEGLLGCCCLTSLRFKSVYCGALPELGPLTRLHNVEVVCAYNLRELPSGMPTVTVSASKTCLVKNVISLPETCCRTCLFFSTTPSAAQQDRCSTTHRSI